MFTREEEELWSRNGWEASCNIVLGWDGDVYQDWLSNGNGVYEWNRSDAGDEDVRIISDNIRDGGR